MKLTGELKKQVEAAATMAEKKDAIENAGMLLDDAELAAVAGGGRYVGGRRVMTNAEYARSNGMNYCPECDGRFTNSYFSSDGITADCSHCKIGWIYTGQ